MSTLTPLQPYRRFEPTFLSQLAYQRTYYLVSQTYRRGQVELDHLHSAVLFTPYKELKDASEHFLLVKKNDTKAGLYDIRQKAIVAKIVNLCQGATDIVPFISLVGNMEYVNRYIDRHYYDRMRSWVRKNRENWNIRQPNSLRPYFETVMGRPMVKIQWGNHSVVVELDELEKI